MKKIVRFFSIALFTAVFTQPLFAADEQAASQESMNMAAATDNSSNPSTNNAANTNTANNKKPMSMSVLVLQLQKAGFIVKGADFDKDKNQFKIDAIDRNGDKQSFELDAATGLAADQKKNPHQLPIAQVVKRLEKNGNFVKSISNESGTFKATTVDSKGNEANTTIDLATGKSS